MAELILKKRRSRAKIFDTTTLPNEYWMDISGYEGFYKVSNFGRIKSMGRLVNCHSGAKFNSEKIIRQINRAGYLIVNLSKENKVKLFLTHRLVAMSFVLNPENKPFVNHLDGNKANAHFNNLEWCTSKENSIHAAKNNLLTLTWVGKTGSKHPKSKEISQLDLNGNLIKVWESATVVNRELNYNRCKIQECARGITSSHYGFIWKYTKVAK